MLIDESPFRCEYLRTFVKSCDIAVIRHLNQPVPSFAGLIAGFDGNFNRCYISGIRYGNDVVPAWYACNVVLMAIYGGL